MTQKRIKDCEEGDILMALDGSKAKVLGRLGSLIFRSDWYRYSSASHAPITVEEAELAGWQVLTKEGKETMDISEVERLLGNVKITCKKKYGK